MKNGRKLLSILLTLCLLAGLMPGIALAADSTEVEYYPLWVGGVQVDSVNCGDITAAVNTAAGKTVAAGSAEYDPTSNTLTLDGFSYEGEGITPVDNTTYSAAVYYQVESETTLTVALVGENSLTVVNDEAADLPNKSYAVYCQDSLTFSGTGTLTAAAGDAGESSYGVYVSDNLTAGATVTGDAGKAGERSYGIGVGEDLTVEDGAAVTGKAGGAVYTGEQIYRYGVYVCYDLTVGAKAAVTGEAGDLSLTCDGRGDVYSYGVYVSEGALTVGEGAAVTGAAGDLSLSLAEARDTYRFNYSEGVCVNWGSLTVKDGATVEGSAGKTDCGATTKTKTMTTTSSMAATALPVRMGE